MVVCLDRLFVLLFRKVAIFNFLPINFSLPRSYHFGQADFASVQQTRREVFRQFDAARNQLHAGPAWAHFNRANAIELDLVG